MQHFSAAVNVDYMMRLIWYSCVHLVAAFGTATVTILIVTCAISDGYTSTRSIGTG